MHFYVSIVPKTPPTANDLIARSQLLKEAGVRYTDRQTWVLNDGYLPLLQCDTELDAGVAEMLELRLATRAQVVRAKYPDEMPGQL